MVHKLLVLVTAIIAITIGFHYAKQLKEFTDLIGTKDRDSLVANTIARSRAQSKNTMLVYIKGQELELEKAVSEEQKRVGLMNREELGEDQGMIFIYNDMNIRSFWMRNTLIPLDMVFLDNKRRVVSIQENAQPCESIKCTIYKSEKPAQYVIELNGGSALELGIEQGDQFVWD